MGKLCVAVLMVVSVLAIARPAAAQVGVPYVVLKSDKWPVREVDRTTTLPAGVLELGVRGNVYLFSVDDEMGDDQTTSFPGYVVSPSVRYGVSDLLTVGLSQNTRILTNPSPTGTADVQITNLNPEAWLRFAGGYDLAAHVQLPIHNVLTESNDPNNPGETTSVFVDLRAAIDGRLRLAENLACLRFHLGVAATEIVGVQQRTKPDLDVRLEYQTTERLMLGARLGLTPFDVEYSGLDDDSVLAPLQLIGQYSISPQLDFTFRGGPSSLSSDHGEHPLMIEAGLLYRP